MLDAGSAETRAETVGQDERAGLSVEVVTQLAALSAAEWDALVPDNDPFTEHAFLSALEESGCVGEDAGWQPVHLVLRDARGLRAAMPLYLKTNSFGEYIFDWGWAEAAQSAGLSYYPKLVSAVPFTPVTGRRVLTRPLDDRPRLVAALTAAARQLADKLDCSSAHLLFCQPDEREGAEAEGYLRRLTYQFHWDNRGYRDFDDYLATFRHSARKAVRRERRRAAESGLQFSVRRGTELDDRSWAAFYAFYRDTTGRKWGQAYLNGAFFELLRERFAERVWVTLASADGSPVAGALCFQKGDSLYGRYWGCQESFDALHFELCYYQPIEQCIAEGWQRFEAGAQGTHKLKRGLLPNATHSAHYLVHPGLRRAVRRHLAFEARAASEEMRLLAAHGPHRRASGSSTP